MATQALTTGAPSRRGLLAAAAALPVAVAALPKPAAADTAEIERIVSAQRRASDRHLALSWVTDGVAVRQRGEPSPEQHAAFLEAADALDDADTALLDYEPQTVPQLRAKAEALDNKWFDEGRAFEIIRGDIARLAGAH